LVPLSPFRRAAIEQYIENQDVDLMVSFVGLDPVEDYWARERGDCGDSAIR
jgi:hypothetical protein